MFSGEAYSFGNDTPYYIDRYTVKNNQVVPDGCLALERPELSRDRYEQALSDINRSWGVIKGRVVDPKTGQNFEVAMANLEAPLENGVDIEMSTFTSSISGNPGNAVELAENAALHPERRRIYVASFGNGQSTYWSAEERKYIRKHGRYTAEDGRPLPTVEALARSLKAANLIMTRCFTTNSAGGGYATALMAALPEGQVSHAYFKSRTNVSDHRLALLWGLGILGSDTLDDIIYRKISNDPWKLTGQMIEEAKARLPNVYSKESQNRHNNIVQKAGSSHKITKMYNDLVAFSRGGTRHHHPAAQDTARALQQQPEALMTYHFPLQDRLYNNVEDILTFVYMVYRLGELASSHIADGQIEVLTPPGKHRDHTQYPGLRWAVEKYAFGRTFQK
jgi:hypothetical protein